MKSSIDIVLATYNGAAYLAEQIESIQSSKRYHELIHHVIVVDDGSTDTTLELLQSYVNSDSRIKIHQNPGPQHGAQANFSYGLSLTTAPFVMLSDQDDVWHEDKMEQSFDRILESSGPALVFTDKRIVDEKLNEICPSFFELRSIDKSWHHSIEQLLQQNVASGCTMMLNRALLKEAMPIPEKAFMHDWWLVLVAKLKGDVCFIDEPLIQYRQHSNNTIGAKAYTFSYLARNIRSHLAKFETYFWRSVIQAEQLYSCFPCDTLAALPFVSVRQVSYWTRLKLFAAGHIRQHSVKGQVALLLTLLRSWRIPKVENRKEL